MRNKFKKNLKIAVIGNLIALFLICSIVSFTKPIIKTIKKEYQEYKEAFLYDCYH